REDPDAAPQRGRGGRVPRPARDRVQRAQLRRARARELRLRRDRHRPLADRLRRRCPSRPGDRRLPERDEGRRGGREGLEAVTRVGVAGLGYWGPNLARNFDDLCDLAWICDETPEQLTLFRGRFL